MTVDQLPAAPWLGYDLVRGNLHGFSQDKVREIVTHATAPLQAEIEALKVDVEAWKASHSMLTDTCHHFQARAKRLKEALRDLLELPIAEEELRILDKGIGTATRNAAWLRARAAAAKDAEIDALLRNQEDGK